jgi:hypothetical protein
MNPLPLPMSSQKAHSHRLILVIVFILFRAFGEFRGYKICILTYLYTCVLTFLHTHLPTSLYSCISTHKTWLPPFPVRLVSTDRCSS